MSACVQVLVLHAGCVGWYMWQGGSYTWVRQWIWQTLTWIDLSLRWHGLLYQTGIFMPEIVSTNMWVLQFDLHSGYIIYAVTVTWNKQNRGMLNWNQHWQNTAQTITLCPSQTELNFFKTLFDWAKALWMQISYVTVWLLKFERRQQLKGRKCGLVNN